MDHVQGSVHAAVSSEQQCSEDDISADLVPNSDWGELLGDKEELVIVPGVALHDLTEPGGLLQGDRLDVPGADDDAHLEPVQLGVSAAHLDPADQPADDLLTSGQRGDCHRPIATLAVLCPHPDYAAPLVFAVLGWRCNTSLSDTGITEGKCGS